MFIFCDVVGIETSYAQNLLQKCSSATKAEIISFHVTKSCVTFPKWLAFWAGWL